MFFYSFSSSTAIANTLRPMQTNAPKIHPECQHIIGYIKKTIKVVKFIIKNVQYKTGWLAISDFTTSVTMDLCKYHNVILNGGFGGKMCIPIQGVSKKSIPFEIQIVLFDKKYYLIVETSLLYNITSQYVTHICQNIN